MRSLVRKLHEDGEHEHAVRLIEAALIHSQSQPWMYEVLAISMELAGRPKEEIERVSLSMADFGPASYDGMMQSSRYLLGLNVPAASMRMLRQAASIAPERPEAYLMALPVAMRLDDGELITWAAAGILATTHEERATAKRNQAIAAARAAVQKQIESGDEDGANAVAARLRDAAAVDVRVTLEWSGAADLDLSVTEPGGDECSPTNTITPGGGMHMGDGFAPVKTSETYLCPRAFNGSYEVRVTRAEGQPVGNRVRLTVAIRQPDGSIQRQRQSLSLDDDIVGFGFTLQGGRRTAARQVSEAPAATPSAERVARLPRLRRTGDGPKRDAADAERPVGAGVVPVVQTIAEGASLQGGAVVSPDRRYVRIGVQPWFANVTDVFTFSAVE